MKNKIKYLLIFILIFSLIMILYFFKNYKEIVNENISLKNVVEEIKENNFLINNDETYFLNYKQKHDKEMYILNSKRGLNKIEHSYSSNGKICSNSFTKVYDNFGVKKIVYGDTLKNYCVDELRFLNISRMLFPICYELSNFNNKCNRAIIIYDFFDEKWYFSSIEKYVSEKETITLDISDIKSGFEGDDGFGEFIRFFDENYSLINKELMNEKYFN